MRPPWWHTTLTKETTLLTYHPERPPWWETTLMTYRPDKRPPWSLFTLMWDHPDDIPPWLKRQPCWHTTWWETTLMKLLKDHPDDTTPMKETTLLTYHPDEKLHDDRSPWCDERPPYSNYWKTTLMAVHPRQDHPDTSPNWWNTTLRKLLKNHPDTRPLWWVRNLWETTLMMDHPEETTLMKDHPDQRPP